MTYNDIISQVKTIFSRGVWSDDDRLSGRYIIQVALRKRARILKQEQEKKKLQDRFSRQRIHCIELIDADKHECECIPIKSTCKIRRTKDKVPSPIKDFLSSVTSIDGGIVYSPTTFQNYDSYKRLSPLRDRPKYYIANEYVYIINDDDKEYISIEGVFEDPLEAGKISCSSDTSTLECYDALQQEFNISPELTDSIILLTIEEIISTYNRGQEDKYNDASSTDVDYTQLKKQIDAIKGKTKNSNYDSTS